MGWTEIFLHSWGAGIKGTHLPIPGKQEVRTEYWLLLETTVIYHLQAKFVTLWKQEIDCFSPMVQDFFPCVNMINLQDLSK